MLWSFIQESIPSQLIAITLLGVIFWLLGWQQKNLPEVPLNTAFTG